LTIYRSDKQQAWCECNKAL